MNSLELDNDQSLELYRVMVRIRTFENGVRRLITDGKIGHVSFCTGGEAVAAGVSAHLSAEDQIGSTHRPLGHLVAKGGDLKRMMAEIMGKSTGTNRGKGGPYHIFDKSVGALGANGVVGGSVPICAGYALANQLRGNDRVAVSYFGEGASNQGGVQETLNLAACWKLPMVFVCENSSPEVQVMLGHEIDYPQLSIDNVGDRGATYGMPGSTHDGWDVEKVYTTVGEAVKLARGGGGPSLLEFKVYRLGADEESKYCPVKCFREKLMEKGVLTEKLDAEIRGEEAKKVKEAIDFAVGSPEPELLDAYKGIFVEDD
ncbi:thiamine pyrophosphate-dependent dehydrogenase E1 component subunit alpha [Candidatus Bathyarchaeota archaeon]|nr:thiamine pyrophosphate-dependent dehydrogenase E1 component subunit alpha [Candidatus Bathyarchaeota archaeon]